MTGVATPTSGNLDKGSGDHNDMSSSGVIGPRLHQRQCWALAGSYAFELKRKDLEVVYPS